MIDYKLERKSTGIFSTRLLTSQACLSKCDRLLGRQALYQIHPS